MVLPLKIATWLGLVRDNPYKILMLVLVIRSAEVTLVVMLVIDNDYDDYDSLSLSCCNRLGVLNNEYLFLTVLEARKSKIKVLEDSVYGEGPLPGSLAVFLLCPHKEYRKLENSLMSLL